MKRRKTILCTILVLLAVSLAGLFWWQRDNLKAIHAATQHTSAELEEKLEENQQMIQEAVKAARRGHGRGDLGRRSSGFPGRLHDPGGACGAPDERRGRGAARGTRQHEPSGK